MVESENLNSMDHDDPPVTLERPTTSQQSSGGEPSAGATPELEDIMVKWRKAMKTACEAQKLLQDVMDEMARQIRANNGKGKKHRKGGQGIMKHKRPSRHCRPRGARSTGEEPIEINSDNNSGSSSDSGSGSSSNDSDVEFVSCHEGTPRHHHDRNRSRSRSRGHSRGHSRGFSRAHSAPRHGGYRHHPHLHHTHNAHPHPHFHFHHHPHHHQHPQHHPHHPHHHSHQHPFHIFHPHRPHPQGNPGFYDYARNQNENTSLNLILDNLPLALTL